jgi:hypothetical protein
MASQMKQIFILAVLLSLITFDHQAKHLPLATSTIIIFSKILPEEEFLVCSEGMVEIAGEYCPVVQENCIRWLDHLRCAEFQKPSQCLSTRTHLHYCMSRFEYPGQEGSFPLVGKDYYQAKKIAEDEGHRLCSIEEFNFACEGEDIKPYGYGDGYHRDASMCNIDKPWIDYSLFSPEDWNDHEMGLYQGVKSDSNSSCKSWAGVYNLNGNVDEILDSEKVDHVILSGGYWSVVRNRCRPKTVAHDKLFSFYNSGFRLCDNVKEHHA